MLRRYLISSVYLTVIALHVAGVGGYLSDGATNVAAFAFFTWSFAMWVLATLIIFTPMVKVRELVAEALHKDDKPKRTPRPFRTTLNVLYMVGAGWLAYYGAFAQAAIIVGVVIASQAAQGKLNEAEQDLEEDWTDTDTCGHMLTKPINPSQNEGKTMQCLDCGLRFNSRDRRRPS